MDTENLSAEELVAEYGDSVQRIAVRLHRRFANFAEVEDLVQLGYLGLLDAQKRWDAEAEPDFMRFAYYRIRGAIFDGLGALTGVGRNDAQTLRRLNAVNETREAELAPSAVADARAHVAQAVQDAEFISDLIDLGMTRDTDTEAGLDPMRSNPEQVFTRKEKREFVFRALDRLEDEESAILKAVYFDGASLAGYAKSADISRSWASRLHVRSLRNLERQWDAMVKVRDYDEDVE